MKRLPAVLLLSALACAAQFAAAASVRQFSPQGRVDRQTQATARFSADMIRLGDTEAPAPFDVNCGAAPGAGRWIDTRAWAWQLERPLQAGERCVFAARSGLVAQNGEYVTGKTRFEFFAAGPWPRSVRPRAGETIAEDQAFVIDAGGPLKLASLDQRLWCEAEGIGHRLPARPVAAAQREAILASLAEDEETGAAALVVACAERLPPGARMKLVWDKGIEAAAGAASEKQESFGYTVRQPFHATFTCEREKAGAPCSPLAGLSLEFSAPVEVRLLRQARLVMPEGTRGPRDPGLEDGRREKTASRVVFPGPFAQNATLRLELPAGLQDDALRPLDNAASFPLSVRTGALPPLAKFPGNFGIVELKEGGLLPVTLRNVEAPLATSTLRMSGTHRLADQRLTDDAEVIATLRALEQFERQTRTLKRPPTQDGNNADLFDPYHARELSFLAGRPGVERRELPKPGGSNEFEVVGIPLTQPGYHIVEIESHLLGAALLATPKPMYVRGAALVTNLSVHLKLGRDNALVWVTALDSGAPVAGADVRVSGCDGQAQWQGKTDGQGRALIEQAIARRDCAGDNFVFASARLGEDYSFVRSDWNQGIEAWRFGVETWSERRDLNLHAVLDRPLFRVGQTVSMKHFARQRGSRGFAFPAASALPATLLIRHNESGTEFTQALSWDAQGSAVSQWKIPDSAKRGVYEITYAGPGGGSDDYPAGGEFRVGDFRLPVYTGGVRGVPARQVATSRVPLALGLSFLNGGAAKGVAVTVSATVQPRWPSFPRYERYQFGAAFEAEALQAFGLAKEDENERLVLDKQPVTLDRAGAGKLEVSLPAKPATAGTLHAEMRFADPNGEIQTIHGNVDLWPADIALGMRVEDWADSRRNGVRAEIVALSLDGQPVAQQDVAVRAQRRVDHGHRRRIVGGFYAQENHVEFIDLGEVCRGRTDARGRLLCQPDSAKFGEPGAVHLLAEARDPAGNVARAGDTVWIAGGGDLWFAAANQDRIDVIPEQREYAPGETARFQVRTPFREATALISVEAGGIVETFVRTLSRFDPVISLPVKATWAPNVYVSVLAVRGRVQPLKWFSFFQWGWREPRAWFKEWWAPAQPTAFVDLAKPAYRLGLGEIGVGGAGFRLKVEVATDQAAYRPREPVAVRLKVTQPDGSPPPAGSEVAFAAVDQALLELRPNDSWGLFDAMVRQRAYEVDTATAQSQVIGKRHFGKKALPPGGGGGRAPARELFDTLLAWEPRVKLGADGTATLKVPLNDSLGEFKLVGIATAGPALFGTGSASVRTRQDLQLISGLPPLVREKDRFSGLLTLRNGTARAMQVHVAARLDGKELGPRTVALEPEGAAELRWEGQAPDNATRMVWEFDASETSAAGATGANGANGKPGTLETSGAAPARDRLKITQTVAPAIPVTVQQATFARVEGSHELPVVAPAGALPGRGGIEIGLSPKLSTPPPGLRRFFETYPFTCLEQQTSVAIGLRDDKRWHAIAESLPGYLDDAGLARYFPGAGPGSVVLTAYLLDLATLAGHALPEEPKRRMLQGLQAYAEGRLKAGDGLGQTLAAAELTTRRLIALEALTRQGHAQGAATRVAAALDIDPPRLPMAALIDWTLVVKRLPELPQRTARLAAATRELRNRLSYAGGRLSFANEGNDGGWWLMVNGDTHAFRLIEAVLDDPDWREDLPRLVRGALERQTRGHWSTTPANAWASVVLERFGQAFERDQVGGTTRAELGKASATTNWSEASLPAPMVLPWPAGGTGAGERLVLRHSGAGKPWATIQTLAAVPSSQPRAAGYRVTRSIQPVQEKTPGKISRGDLWRVSLRIDADQDMNWVVLSDPVPAGARILGDGDGRDSRLDQGDENPRQSRFAPTYVERAFDFFRAYYERLPRGTVEIEYTLRLNNAGEFNLPPTRVEAMYAPDLHGEVPNAKVLVGE